MFIIILLFSGQADGVWETLHKTVLSVISGFRRDADEICALLGYYAASNGNPLLTFRDNVSLPSSRVKKSLTLEDGTDMLSRKVGKGLPLDAA
jgi:hypothetical protein